MRQLTTRLSNSVQLRFRSKTQVTNTLEKFRLSMNLGNGTWAITKEKSNQKLNLKKSGPPKRMKKFRQNPQKRIKKIPGCRRYSRTQKAVYLQYFPNLSYNGGCRCKTS